MIKEEKVDMCFGCGADHCGGCSYSMPQTLNVLYCDNCEDETDVLFEDENGTQYCKTCALQTFKRIQL